MKPVKRITGRALQQIRARHFQAHPYCVECLKRDLFVPATELDHIIALHKGGPDFDKDDGKNRQGLCHACHEKKSKTERGHRYKPKVRIGPDGWPIRQK